MTTDPHYQLRDWISRRLNLDLGRIDLDAIRDAVLDDLPEAPKPSLELVREFHEKFGHPIADNPDPMLDGRHGPLRIGLLKEELGELHEAIHWGTCSEVFDALCDLQYVLDGAFLALGFHRYKDAGMAEVHRSNMSKLGADGKPILRADGKILKGPNYTPPDLSRVMREVDEKDGKL